MSESARVGDQVALNSGAARVGAITIGGQVFAIVRRDRCNAGAGKRVAYFAVRAGGAQWSMDIFVTNVVGEQAKDSP